MTIKTIPLIDDDGNVRQDGQNDRVVVTIRCCKLQRGRDNARDLLLSLSYGIISKSQVDQPATGRTPSVNSRCTGTVTTIHRHCHCLRRDRSRRWHHHPSAEHPSANRRRWHEPARRREHLVENAVICKRSLRQTRHVNTANANQPHSPRGCLSLSFSLTLTGKDHDGALLPQCDETVSHTRQQGQLLGVETRDLEASSNNGATRRAAASRRRRWRKFETRCETTTLPRHEG